MASDATLTAPGLQVCVPLPAAAPWDRPPQDWATRLSGAPGLVWFDSADAKAGAAAWSCLALNPVRSVEVRGREAILRDEEGRTADERVRPMALLARELRAVAKAPRANVPFASGWFAMLSYDLGRDVERLPEKAAADLAFPDLYLARHDMLLGFDHAQGRWHAACRVPDTVRSADREKTARAKAERALEAAANAALVSKQPAPRAVRSNFTRPDYEAAVERVLEYIAAGDIYQANLTQRFDADWDEGGLALYLRLRRESPARYGCFADLGGGRSIGSISPELFLEKRGERVVTRPIKGTRPRGATAEADAAMRAELEGSAKDRAELTMIVDLERNDLGRVCDYGSVRVANAGELEAHPTVFHRVASVEGRLHHRRTVAGLLRATFPGGSVTGAPKIRAMQIIEELEPTRRGPYCGALGWLGDDGDVTLNLAIRTALLDEKAKRAYYQAGGGIVADSTPAGEYDETLAKARAFFRAVNGTPG
ncbi:MAG: aminodeoxychorismate synthase component I [Planctomycetes bacterium]|nr:aminodeoxychorismate synthase component I [Planctomycetota bacterium]